MKRHCLEIVDWDVEQQKQTNKTFFSSDIYRPQKLLSINGFESAHILPGVNNKDSAQDHLKDGFKDLPGFVPEPHYNGPNLVHEVDSSTVFPALAFLGTALVVLFLVNQYYRGKSKPKRKRPRLKKLHNFVYGYKGPSV